MILPFCCCCCYCADELILKTLLLLFHQEDDDARAIVLESLLKDGMDLQFNLKFLRVEHTDPEEEGDFPIVKVFVEQNGQEKVSQESSQVRLYIQAV